MIPANHDGDAAGDVNGMGTMQARERIRIVLVAGVRLYRDGLAAELDSRPGLSMVGVAGDLDTAVGSVRRTRPDVVLFDIGMRQIIDLVQAVRSTHAPAHIVALAVDESERDIAACAEAGVTGFVTRDVGVDGLAEAIAAAVRGELTCSPRAAALLFRRVAELSTLKGERRAEERLLSALTSRERQIASLLAAGRANKEISALLNIEVTTVKNHVHRILEKLQVATRTEAAIRMRDAVVGN
ncbi:MAG: response regulator transcription factor [Gemmatimonadota bacterium]